MSREIFCRVSGNMQILTRRGRPITWNSNTVSYTQQQQWAAHLTECIMWQRFPAIFHVIFLIPVSSKYTWKWMIGINTEHIPKVEKDSYIQSSGPDFHHQTSEAAFLHPCTASALHLFWIILQFCIFLYTNILPHLTCQTMTFELVRSVYFSHFQNKPSSLTALYSKYSLILCHDDFKYAPVPPHCYNTLWEDLF